MKKTILRVIGITISTIIFMQNICAFAVSEKQQLENQKSQINNEIQENIKKKEELEEKKSETMKSVENLIGKISESENEIDKLEDKITDLQAQIKSKERDIQQKEDEYTEQEKMLENRLIAMSKKGKTTYIDVIFTAESITDFISKYYYASEIIEYDKELIRTTKEQKAKIEDEKKELVEDKKELDTSLAVSEKKSVELKSLKNEKEKYAKQLTEEEKKVQQKIEELEAANKKIANEIKQAEIRYQKQLEELSRQNGGSSNVPTGSGYFARPVSSGSINATAYYSSGKFHGGIDYGVATGTTVMAAADGVVMSTANLSTSYGTYIVIRHANGLQTYYAHGTYDSICVKPGDLVKRGQKIMLSGNTGNSTGPHLHFEVRKSPYNYNSGATAYGHDSRVNPSNYL